MKLNIKYKVDVDPEVKKEMERLADHLDFKLEIYKQALSKCTIIVQEGWLPCNSVHRDRNFYSKGKKVSFTVEAKVVDYPSDYLMSMCIISDGFRASAAKLRSILKERYPDLHDEHRKKHSNKKGTS